MAESGTAKAAEETRSIKVNALKIPADGEGCTIGPTLIATISLCCRRGAPPSPIIPPQKS
jgi:hypothetical protein